MKKKRQAEQRFQTVVRTRGYRHGNENSRPAATYAGLTESGSSPVVGLQEEQGAAETVEGHRAASTTSTSHSAWAQRQCSMPMW